MHHFEATALAFVSGLQIMLMHSPKWFIEDLLIFLNDLPDD
jgi:hypothetical protein